MKTYLLQFFAVVAKVYVCTQAKYIQRSANINVCVRKTYKTFSTDLAGYAKYFPRIQTE